MNKLSKRICSLTLALVMFFGILPAIPAEAAFSTPTWHVGHVNAVAGERVEVDIFLINATEVYGGNFTLQYDSTMLEVQSCSYSKALDAYTKNCNLNYQSTGNQIRFTFSGAQALKTDGIVATLVFNVKESVEGISNLTFTNCKLYSTNGTTLSASVENGSVTVKELKKIYLNTPVKVTVSYDEPTSYLCFTPEESGIYYFYSTSNVDTYGAILDENENELAKNDDGGMDFNFKVSYAMTAGRTYIMMSRLYSYEGGSYEVTVEKSNVTSVAFNNISVIEGCSYTEYEYNEATGEYDLEWEKYAYSVSGTITLDDGSIVDFEDGFYEEQDCRNYVEYSDNQSYNTPWRVGNTYTVTGTLMGVTNTFSVTIVQNPIKELAVSKVSIIEGTNQTTAGEWVDGEYVEYLKYYYGNLEYTVTFQDGTSQTVSHGNSITIEGKNYQLSWWDNQSSSNVWGVGEHTVNASLMGVKTTFIVEITETPIASIVINNDTVTEGISGWKSTRYDEETDSYVTYFQYVYDPSFVITMKDGTVYVSECDDHSSHHVIIDDEWYWLSFSDTQSMSPWGVGEHTVTGTILGVPAEFNVEVIVSPIISVVFDDISLIEGFDGWMSYEYNSETDEYETSYFYYEYSPSCTVTYVDGTIQKSTDGYITYDNENYRIEYNDTQYENHWNVGTYKLEATLFGFEGSFDVIIHESPYESLSISGTTELLITLTKKNGETEKMKATGFEWYEWHQGECGGQLYTTGQDKYVYFSFYELNGEPNCCKNLVLTMGSLVSNSLDGNTWLKASMLVDDYKWSALAYRDYRKYLFGEQFVSFNGVVTDDNIDDVVILATNMCDDIWDSDDVVEIDGEYYALMDIEVVEENIEQTFGITNIDLTKASGYDSFTPSKIKVPRIEYYSEELPIHELYYSDGNWIFEMTSDSDEWTADYDSLKIVMNEEIQIVSIEFVGSVIIPRLTGIEIETEVIKTDYEIGETIDTTGLSIKLLYSDGSSEIITNGFVVNGFDSVTAGSKTLTITYEGFSTSYVVSVVEKEILETDPQIVVSSGVASRGKQIKVPISLKNNPGIASATLRVKYNSDVMTLIGVEDTGNLGTTVHSDQFANPYVLNWVNDTITENIIFNGEIVILTFEVADNVAYGSYAINVYYDYDNYDIYDVDAQKVKFYSIDGTINIVDTIIGDVNSDGAVNNLDRMVLTRYLANWQDYTEESIDKIAADVNSDGVVNNLDRMVLTRHLANWQGYDVLPHIS